MLGAALGLAPWTMPAAARAQAPAGAVREIEVVVDGGYRPARDYGGCLREVVFPSLGLRRELPAGQPVVVEVPARRERSPSSAAWGWCAGP